MKKIILTIAILFSIAQAEQRFTRDTDVVTDHITGLEWQDNLTSTKYKWEASINHCEAMTLSGHSDWRLPNLIELKSLFDYSKIPAYPRIFRTITANDGDDKYWSSTTDNYYREGAMATGFDQGSVGGYYKSGGDGSMFCICVRDAE